MPTINDAGNIIAICPGCDGSKSTYSWHLVGKPLGHFASGAFRTASGDYHQLEYRLYKCSGCDRGGFGVIERHSGSGNFPNGGHRLREFYPFDFASLRLPSEVPDGIRAEFEEAEKCLSVGCCRAAAGLFRSVLDKTLRANGYKLKKGTTLEQQIDLAAGDKVIAESRRLKAHADIRVLGNDVLHDDWVEIPEEDAEMSRHYC